MHTDILIVGGGLSGLALADRLERQGRDWLLTEVRDRLGGRILSPDIAGAHFDLGPAWFWPGQPQIEQMLRRFDIDVFEQFSQGATVFQNGSGAVQTYHGFSPMAGSMRVAGGMGALIGALEQVLPSERVMLRSAVSGIKKTSEGVCIEAGSLSINANHVVLAVPPRVVAETISFEPGLPEEAHKSMETIPTWMAGQAKILAVYERPYWREAGLSGDGISQRGPMVEIHDASPMETGPYALFGFVGVPPGVRAEHPERVLELAQDQLIAMFGEGMRNPVHLQMLDWAKEKETAVPLDLNSQRSHPSYGLPPSLSRLWDGKVLLGSTETAPVHGGFLEGALEAAERVENALLDAALEKTPRAS